MQHGVLSRTTITLGNNDFYVDYQDNRYYGESAHKYYVPSALNDSCWGFDFTKQFKTEANCTSYMNKCISKTCKSIIKSLKEQQCQ